jgi:hypothetical protein
LLQIMEAVQQILVDRLDHLRKELADLDAAQR